MAREQKTIQQIELLAGKAGIVTARGWNFTVSLYNKPGSIIRVNNCFAIMFTNVGDTKGFVNGMVVFPSLTPLTALGDSRSLAGHVLDLFIGKLEVSFENPTVGTAPNIEVIQLFYAESFNQ